MGQMGLQSSSNEVEQEVVEEDQVDGAAEAGVEVEAVEVDEVVVQEDEAVAQVAEVDTLGKTVHLNDHGEARTVMEAGMADHNISSFADKGKGKSSDKEDFNAKRKRPITAGGGEVDVDADEDEDLAYEEVEQDNDDEEADVDMSGAAQQADGGGDEGAGGAGDAEKRPRMSKAEKLAMHAAQPHRTSLLPSHPLLHDRLLPLWEVARRVEMGKEERKKAVEELYEAAKGRILEISKGHKGGRVLQTVSGCLAYFKVMAST